MTIVGSTLRYLGLFILGYFVLIHFGWDNYELPQWILIFLVAFHRFIIDNVRAYLSK